jgi:3-oxoacyl-[acyl-carrier-protein] synthase II
MTSPPRRRAARAVPRAEPVAVVAAGVCTAVGQDLDSFWSALLNGGDGISPIERFPVEDLRVGRGGEIKKLSRDLDWQGISDCRATRLLVSAADEVCGQVGSRPLPFDPRRVAVVVGTALGGVEEGERALEGDGPAERLRGALYDAPARNLSRWLGAEGPVLTAATACAAGGTAIGMGADLLRHGLADAVVAGGYDILCRFVMRGFDVLRALTRERVRPFDRRRSGLLLGEAAALVLLRRQAEAGPGRLGHVLGHATISDGHHVSAPHPEGRGLEAAVRAALAEAGVGPEHVDFVSAHGTATPLNDPIESAVLRRVLGRRAASVPVNSIKAAVGHTMGAAAALEAIMCLLASRHGLVPPTLHLEQPDAACDLDCVRGEPRAVRPRISLSTCLGFGGCNGALVLEGASP